MGELLQFRQQRNNTSSTHLPDGSLGVDMHDFYNRLSSVDALSIAEIAPRAVGLGTDLGERDVMNTYGVEEEVAFIRANGDKPPDELEYYLGKNLETFGVEFGGMMAYDSVPGIVSQDRLEICRHDMLASTQSTARLSEEISQADETRETAENEGLKRAHAALFAAAEDARLRRKDPTEVRVTWFSPPRGCETEYSFAFNFKITGYLGDGRYTFTEELLRYDESYSTITNSKRKYTKLQGLVGQPFNAHTFRTDRDFLENPIVYTSSDELDSRIIGEVFDIDTEDIEFTAEFKERMSVELAPLRHGYISAILELSRGNLDMSDPDIQSRLADMQEMIGKIYYWSHHIHGQMVAEREPDEAGIWKSSQRINVSSREADQVYLQAKANGLVLLSAGSNCPRVRGRNSVIDVYNNLANGMSLTESIHKRILCCTCPHCDKKVEAVIENGKIHCPSCKATASWKESGAQTYAIDEGVDYDDLPLAA